MAGSQGAGQCLNCGAPIHGPFCAACGQRSIPPNPTVAELVGDAFNELSGYDGRVMATLRGLVRPGFLTREYLGGRRARYLSPVRIYLTVSVIYFLVAAAAPNLGTRRESVAPGINIEIPGQDGGVPITPEERAVALEWAEQSPRWAKPLLRAVIEDPEGFRARVLTVMPRVFFAVLPVFAAIVAMFYRGRTFPTSLVFAVHVHAFAFVVFTVSEVVKFTRSPILAAAVGLIGLLAFTVYSIRALRAVFGGGWLVTQIKALAIGLIYGVASVPAFVLILLWAIWS